MKTDLHLLGAREIHQALSTGAVTARAVAEASLARIARRDGDVQAFVAVDAARALAEADRIDAGAAAPLRGVPFAVKDVIDTRDYPTRYGSPVYAGYQPAADAGCVAVSRRRGGLLMGKVHTCEFATQTPTVTRNPLDLSRTPGGSSSGSAAAVADFMVPVAFGTQTTGSTIRPAVYCGIVGYKPTFGFFNRAGLKALSPTQDTITVFARSVADAAFFSFGYHGVPAPAAHAEPSTLRIGILRSGQWAHARPETHAAIERFVGRLAAAGARVTDVSLPPAIEAMLPVQNAISAFEAAQGLSDEYRFHRDALSPRLRTRIEGAMETPPDVYLGHLRAAAEARQAVAALFDGVDVLLYPAAEGEAEVGLEETGSPRYGALWSLLHVPTVSFPIAAGPAGLPLGVQLIGRFGDDARLCAVAETVSALGEYELACRE